MRQTILITTCAFALLLFFVPLSGQNTFTVVYDTVNWISPPQAGPQDTINYTLRVSHNLPGDYAGPIDIMARVGGGTPFMLFSSLQDSIPPGPGGKLYSIRDTVDLARYGGGINIVVVWPTAPNFTAVRGKLKCLICEISISPSCHPDEREKERRRISARFFPGLHKKILAEILLRSCVRSSG
jgi:hypothetical protein